MSILKLWYYSYQWICKKDWDFMVKEPFPTKSECGNECAFRFFSENWKTGHPQGESKQNIIGLNLKLGNFLVQTDWTNLTDWSEKYYWSLAIRFVNK